MPKKDETMILTRNFKVSDFRAIAPGDGAKQNMLEGHAAVFDTITNIGNWYQEKIDQRAFDGCDFDDVLFFINHNTDKIPLARSRRNNGNSTMQLKVDEVGLFVSATLDVENNSEARQLYSSVARGDMDGMSFMFRVADDKWSGLDTDMPTRTILKIAKVFECSAVNWPAYPTTDISARDQMSLDNDRRALDNARRSQELDNSREVNIYKLKNKILGGM